MHEMGKSNGGGLYEIITKVKNEWNQVIWHICKKIN